MACYCKRISSVYMKETRFSGCVKVLLANKVCVHPLHVGV